MGQGLRKYFLKFNNRVNDSMDLSNLYSDFLGTFRECMDEVVLKKQVKVTGRRKRPPWYNEELQKARHEVYILSRTYKRCNTRSNLKKNKGKRE